MEASWLLRLVIAHFNSRALGPDSGKCWYKSRKILNGLRGDRKLCAGSLRDTRGQDGLRLVPTGHWQKSRRLSLAGFIRDSGFVLRWILWYRCTCLIWHISPLVSPLGDVHMPQ